MATTRTPKQVEQDKVLAEKIKADLQTAEWQNKASGFLHTFCATASQHGWDVTLLDEAGVQYLGGTHLWPTRTVPEGGAIAVKPDSYVLVTAFSTANSVMPRLDCAVQDGKRLGTVYQTLRALSGEDTAKDPRFKKAKKEEEAPTLTAEAAAEMSKSDLIALATERGIAVSKRASKSALIEALAS